MSQADALVDALRPAVRDERVLDAMRATPRDLFVAAGDRGRAWENKPLPTAEGQTISQPLVVARMCELLELRGHETVLDVGAGSGYHAAILSRLCRRVYAIERHAVLCEWARAALREAGVANVTVIEGDGTAGWPEAAPYEAINVAAAGAGIPAALEDQLAEGARLVLPVGTKRQRLVLVRRTADGLERERLEPVSFVPLI